MELRCWAEQVLFGETLADKLADPAALTDLEPGPAIPRPAAPGRPPGLAFGAPPAPHRALRDPSERGLLLHSFANHELLAAELMALTLLRFPEAPRPFRLGLAAALREEQAHLRLYLERMAALGVGFGEAPVNRFFWDCLAAVESPLAFVAGMGLGFEQANLDFALHYARAFRAVGDEDTARVLDRVLQDEVGHVRLGLTWLRRWKEPGLDDFTAWRRALPAPLSPARARGPDPTREPRLEAGLDDSFLRQLDAFGASRGRLPDVYHFDPSCEDRLAGADPGAGAALARDLGLLPLALCGRDDLIVLSRRPSDAFLASLRPFGFELPELVEASGPDDPALRSRPLGSPRPWGWHPGLQGWQPAWGRAYDKRLAVELSHQLRQRLSHLVASYRDKDLSHFCRIKPIEEATRIATDMSQMLDHIAYFCDRCPGEILLKAPIGTAGRGARRWRGGEARPWAERVLAEQGGLLVEPWRERLADLSAQADGPHLRGLTRFFATPAGRWRASLVGPWDLALSPELRRFIHADGQAPGWVERALGGLLAAIADVDLPPGPRGIDAFLYQGPQGPVLRPLVEINPRLTMGRVALELRRRLAPRRVGLFAVLSRADARAAGFPSLEAWLAARPAPRGEGSLSEGVLSLTEPGPGLSFAGVLAAGRDLSEAWAALG